MIDPKSLRIGNYIISTREYFDKPTLGRVYQISASNIFIEYTEDNGEIRGISNPLHVLSGIPLSEQELIRLGFRLEEEAHHKFPCVRDTYDRTKIVERLDRIYRFRESSIEDSAGDMSILVILDPHHPVKLRSISIIGVRETFCCADLQYVHQLQNAYYLLSGELELEYKVGKRNYKAMNNLETDILKVLIENHIQSNTSITAKAAASVAMKWMCEFRDWYDKLSPAEKCTVWPPAGSGSGTGLYNMQTEDIVDKFLSYKKKLATPTEPDTKEPVQ